jgi:hypothetical protein
MTPRNSAAAWTFLTSAQSRHLPLSEEARVADHRRKEDDHEGGVLDARSCLVRRAGGDGVVGLSRTQIYELIRSRRLVTVTQGRRRLVPADSISEYVQLLLRESGGDDGRAA